ncbi:MAG: 3-isopropylmalate dehydratase large subunit [Thermoplasmata archaeon]|nr:3-isopropylmalate dehydratase large subunit [Thermoplasmata archaeon]
MGMTIAEKVLSAHAGHECHAGDHVVASVDFCMSQDGTSLIMMRELEKLGFSGARTTRGMAIVLDHSSPPPSAGVSRIHAMIRRFAAENGVPLHDIGEGVCHQVIPESGKVLPGDLVLGADSHTCTYGALNACATGLGSTDVAVGAATGKMWFKVPESMRISLSGVLGRNVGAKDLALHLVGKVGAGGATYKSMEYGGGSVASLPMDSRMTIANMGVEMGAKFSPFGFDGATAEWFSSHGLEVREGVSPDGDAAYCESIDIDMSDVPPMVARPHRVDDVCEVSSVAGTHVDQVVIGTCTNGRVSDLAAAARIVRGKRVKSSTRLIVAPASRRVYLEAAKAGSIEALISAGAIIVAPGCGPCVGTNAGVPADGETVLSTANRNFKGRMGNENGVNIFLCSPETAAASALRGEIADPREVS